MARNDRGYLEKHYGSKLNQWTQNAALGESSGVTIGYTVPPEFNMAVCDESQALLEPFRASNLRFAWPQVRCCLQRSAARTSHSRSLQDRHVAADRGPTHSQLPCEQRLHARCKQAPLNARHSCNAGTTVQRTELTQAVVPTTASRQAGDFIPFLPIVAHLATASCCMP